jgi:diguanylate cyclase (GGDEF)-like protein
MQQSCIAHARARTMSPSSISPAQSPAADFERMFHAAPISLWLEDYSELKTLFEEWRSQGVVDLAMQLRKSPELMARCSSCLKVLQVNQQTLKVFAARDQQDLVSRLSEVFRDDTFEQMLTELLHLWAGTLSFSNVSVNYALDGRRIDIEIHVCVLQGHESTWDRVMVSLEDVTDKVMAQQKLIESEQYARSLFDHSPVSLWVEDFSGVKVLLDEARAQGIQDFRVFVSVHPDFVSRCAENIKVLDVNQQTLQMFAAHSKDELLSRLDVVFRDEMHDSFTEQLLDLWNGNTTQMREVVNYSLSGAPINIHMQFSVMAGHEANWDLVLVSLVDITARKKAEAYLEYLGKHDSLTKLHNRAFYSEELNRISRKGPWPLSILAMDLNGLKAVNDLEGHAAGDSLLRRVGEVLSSASAGTNFCVSRVGGDEFVALLPGCDERVAQSFKERIESMVEINNQYYSGRKISLAIGIATAPTSTHVDALSHEADKAMFAAKTRFYEDSKVERRR